MKMNAVTYLITFLILSFGLCSSKACLSEVKTPSLNWKFTSNAPFFSSPVTDGNSVFIGGDDSIFRALDLENGNLLWEFKTKGKIRSTALIENDKIYLNGGDGNLYILNTEGKLIRTVNAGQERQYDFADYHQSSPVFFNNTVFFGLGDGFVYAVNSDKGELKWKFRTEDVVHSTPVLDSSRLYIGSFNGNVYALNISDGSLLWKFKTVGHTYFPKGEVQGSPSLSDDLVFIGARDYNFYAIDKEKGYCHWNKVFKKGWVLTSMVNDTALYIEGADERIISAMNPQTGKEYWKRDMEFLMFGRAAFSGTILYAGTTIGKLHAIDKLTGSEVWTFSTDGYLNNRMKYFKVDDSYRDDIYSIIKSNEQFLEVEMELGGIFSTPVITNGYLVFTSTEGIVYCLKNKN
ncbi:MAG TPA: PQQ-binding-like beta-propeller repeat protein [Ignavibacteria bacterium]|nr:PQQ-binding-like beta-propeller repeat protein [Ignavibacteria bacterium]